jgi:phthiocerol/phenolphthiocerol synthesis type-I polyketide synthase E
MTESTVTQQGLIDRLSILWATVLETEEVRADADFFDLGGDSLLAIGLIALIKDELGADVPLRTIFDYPTLREMAGAVASFVTVAAD